MLIDDNKIAELILIAILLEYTRIYSRVDSIAHMSAISSLLFWLHHKLVAPIQLAALNWLSEKRLDKM